MKNRLSPTRQVNGKERIAVTMRFPEALLRQIDRYIETRDVPISRNNWLLEAAAEKLERQEKRQGNRYGS